MISTTTIVPLFDVLDQKSYIQYVHETYFYPNQDPASFSALTTTPVATVNKKDLPCFKFAAQNCDLGDNCPYNRASQLSSCWGHSVQESGP